MECNRVSPFRLSNFVASFPSRLLFSLACAVVFIWIFGTLALARWKNQGESDSMKMERTSYGKTTEGTPVDLFTLTNSAGHKVQLTNYGAILIGVEVPDRKGELANVTLGFPNLEGYLQRHPYFGSTVGRFCNRIAKGSFSVDGKQYSLAINNGPNHLHGGIEGFDRKVWSAEELKSDQSVGIRFTLVSPDGDEGYPGNLTVMADYIWGNDSKLIMRFMATSDKTTPINITNHAYFNLGGQKGGAIYDHVLQLSCSKYLTVDSGMIPTGAIADVVNTPMDFRNAHPIGDHLATLTATNGYDHCFVVDGTPGALRLCAVVVDPKTGRAMEVHTTQPGVQLYTGNFLAGSESTGGFKQHEAFCLETQHYPDAPNKPEFPTSFLKPGEKYDQTTTYRFYTK